MTSSRGTTATSVTLPPPKTTVDDPIIVDDRANSPRYFVLTSYLIRTPCSPTTSTANAATPEMADPNAHGVASPLLPISSPYDGRLLDRSASPRARSQITSGAPSQVAGFQPTHSQRSPGFGNFPGTGNCPSVDVNASVINRTKLAFISKGYHQPLLGDLPHPTSPHRPSTNRSCLSYARPRPLSPAIPPVDPVFSSSIPATHLNMKDGMLALPHMRSSSSSHTLGTPSSSLVLRSPYPMYSVLLIQDTPFFLCIPFSIFFNAFSLYPRYSVRNPSLGTPCSTLSRYSVHTPLPRYSVLTSLGTPRLPL